MRVYIRLDDDDKDVQGNRLLKNKNKVEETYIHTHTHTMRTI